MSAGVMVLNASFEPMHRVDLKHAIRMMIREVAVVEESEPDKMIGHLPFPKVLRLVKYVSMKWRTTRDPSWSRRRLLARDKNTCVYCGKPANTVDHITPLSLGGKSTWLNTVASCSPCNTKKANRTIAESRMHSRVIPWVPSWWDLNIIS